MLQYLKIISRPINPVLILVGGTTVGRSLAPRVAARFRTGLTAQIVPFLMYKKIQI